MTVIFENYLYIIIYLILNYLKFITLIKNKKLLKNSCIIYYKLIITKKFV